MLSLITLIFFSQYFIIERKKNFSAKSINDNNISNAIFSKELWTLAFQPRGTQQEIIRVRRNLSNWKSSLWFGASTWVEHAGRGCRDCSALTSTLFGHFQKKWTALKKRLQSSYTVQRHQHARSLSVNSPNNNMLCLPEVAKVHTFFTQVAGRRLA